MKKIFLLVMLALSICCTAFAGHTPNREELNQIQTLFSGYYFNDKGKDITNYLEIDDTGIITFMHKGKYHTIKEPNLQVDFNNGISITFKGNCSENGCDFQGWDVSVSPLGYQSRRTPGIAFSLLLMKPKDISNIKPEEIKDVSDVFFEESYVVRKMD